MNHLDKELLAIKDKVNEMWSLVEFQMLAGKDALLNGDEELLRKIIKRGKKVNAYDIKIDRMCENIFALYNPVAVDLRWLMAILKINANIERIGDSSEGIAQLIREANFPVDPELLETTRVLEMYDAAESMLADVQRAFYEENTELARDLIKRDKLLNKIHVKTDKVIIRYIQAHPDNINQSLKVSGIIRKLERIGDQITNIAEEIIFYVDAKVVKHKQKKKRGKDPQ
ncbi:phosphate signaling complex protein PhoU [Rufibacter glacialis]|uniref:Phosphate-specific transport system accessory protein PhoU n=1 Tax=Rufibacter glacialis TaxID=1259555 RepID=A0A5M8QJZ9_9BACT|nr:phosphate signaling complex protein PhoU [Rufibacter glacialis]KAA6435481.1 phosphate signaling complex protein PhoU [Rufibacter glacialis]GGK63867.1 phosphate transport system regulatory protein PhoU [Rufibacter glacialis]